MATIIDDAELNFIIASCKSPLLVEPLYRRKYPPLGLMKISSAIKRAGIQPTFTRVPQSSGHDVIFVTTLFTYDLGDCISAIRDAAYHNPNAQIVVGGVAASVKPDEFIINDRTSVYTGFSKYLDQFAPDYETDWKTDDEWKDWSFAFTTRGCPNTCAYCFVPKIEKGMSINKDWKSAIRPGRQVMLYDNNMTAFGAEHVRDVGHYLRTLKKRVRLDNAVDCKYCDDEMAKALAMIPYDKRGLRTAFDRISEDGIFQPAMKRLIENGISKYNIMAYVLYNFNDTPKEANYRAEQCVACGVIPYPAAFRPINSFSRQKSEKYIGKHWTPKLITAFSSFWLYASKYTKMTFDQYLEGDGLLKHKLTDLDMDAWRIKI